MFGIKKIIGIRVREKWIDSASVFILCASIGFVLSFSIGFFKPILVAVASAIATICISAFLLETRENDPEERKLIRADFIVLLIIVLVALAFRYEPYPYVVGGQDQGVYVNMASTYARNETAFITDDLRRSIDRSDIVEIYDNNNYRTLSRNVDPNHPAAGKREGAYLPGIYVKDYSKSEYVFQFYHMHSLWMAFFTKLFGVKGGLYSLSLFSLLSIASFFLVSLELIDSKRIAASITLLLALNPLHVFFSKWPVSEIVALFFTTMGFYYLLRFCNEKNVKNSLVEKIFPLLLAALFFGCFFLTRVSGFMYVPFFLMLIFYSIISGNNSEYKSYYIWFSTAVLVIYSISILYGLTYSYPYSIDIYRISFQRFFGNNWGSYLSVLCVLLILFLLSVEILCKNEKIRHKILGLTDGFSNHLHHLIYAVVLFGLYKYSILAFTDKYVDHSTIGKRWHLAGTGIDAFRSCSLFVAAIYLSPVIFFVFIFFIKHLRSSNIFRCVLFLAALFWAYISLLKWVIPHQYYYTRYLLTEIVPISILSIGIIIQNIPSSNVKKAISIGMVIVSAYYVYIDSYQFKGVECDGAYESIERIHEYVTPEDLVILNRNNFRHYSEIKTPLVYIFNDNVFDVKSIDDLRQTIGWGISKYTNVYVLSQKKMGEEYLWLIGKFPFRQSGFERVRKIPRKYHEKLISLELYLYKADLDGLCRDNIKKTHRIDLKDTDCIEKYGFYGDNVWTDGDAVISNIDYILRGKDSLVLNTYNFNPYRNDLIELNLKVFLNENELPFIAKTEQGFVFNIDREITKIDTIRIITNTFVPKDVGINQDSRKLGIDIKSIEFK